MRKSLNNPWIVSALALAAVAFVGQSLWPKRIIAGPAAAPAVAPVAESAATNQPPGDATMVQSAEELLALTGQPARRDPFAPAGKTVAAMAAVEKARPDLVDTVHLSAVWAQEGAVYAVINDTIVRPGDAIGRLKIESATTDGVWLVHWKGRDHLALGGDFTLRTPAAGSPEVSQSDPSNGAALASSL